MKTIVNGKEICIYSINDIITIYSNKVAEYLTNGYIFYSNGNFIKTTNEKMAVNLTNDSGKTIIRIVILQYEYGNSYGIMVLKFNNILENKGVLWNCDGEILLKKNFIRFKKDIYVNDKNDLDELEKVHMDRYERRQYNSQKSFSSKVALKLAKKHKGYKSITFTDIESVERISNDKAMYKIIVIGKAPIYVD